MTTKSNGEPRRMPFLSSGDLDGFFGLFIDNLLQLMLISVLCQYACGFSLEFVTGRILPGAALSILGGNLFYAWQARQLARRTGRTDVTALPFGINTVSLLAFIFLVMGPVYAETGDSDLAWKVGLAACFLSGILETAGAFVGSWIRRNTPRVALLSGLAGVALSFMGLSFSFQIFANPSVALVPALLVLIVYGARVKLPLR
jgi:AGZA family xanthine/uracil permease-like MFS transporter